MRRVLTAVSVVAVALAGSRAPAQTAQIQQQVKKQLNQQKASEKNPEVPPGLQQMLEQALRANPDIRVAEAKLRDAEAELSRTRLKVMTRVVELQHEIRALKSAVDFAQKRYTRLKDLAEHKSVDQRLVDEQEAPLLKAKAELAKAEAEFPYLLGNAPLTGAEAMAGDASAVARALRALAKTAAAPAEPGVVFVPYVAPGVHAKVHKALDEKIKLDHPEGVTLKDLADFLQEHSGGLNVTLALGPGNLTEVQFPLAFKQPVAVGAVYEWLEDQFPVRCVVRDYGIVIAVRERVPPGAAHLLDLWRSAPEAP